MVKYPSITILSPPDIILKEVNKLPNPNRIAATSSKLCEKHISMAVHHGGRDMIAQKEASLTAKARLLTFFLRFSPKAHLLVHSNKHGMT